MSDYTKLKVDELQTHLKERGLAHTGKKADLIKRLEDDDASKKTVTRTGGAEDEIDWDDDTNAAPTSAAAATTTSAAATSQPAAAAIAAGGATQPANPRAVPNQVPAEDVTTSTDLTVQAPGPNSGILPDPATVTEAAAAKSTVPVATLQDEIAKRKARHAKFGTDANADERLKALERQAKFGGGAAATADATNGSTSTASMSASDQKMLKGLNSSLDEIGAQRKAASAAAASSSSASASASNSKTGSKRGRTGPVPGTGAGEPKKQKVAGPSSSSVAAVEPSKKTNGSWMSEDDKAKAAARKARFGNAAV